MTLLRTLLLAVLCLAPLTAPAQITVTSATFPQVGDTLHAVVANDPFPVNLFYIPPGFNLHWDFSQLGVGQRISTTFLSASAGVYATNFPDADMVVTNSTGETYYRTSAGKLEMLGCVGSFRGAVTDTFALTYVVRLVPPMVARPTTINAFDIRQSVPASITVIPVDALPESIRTALPSGEFVDAVRLGLAFSVMDVVDGGGDLIVPGMLAPKPVLRIKRLIYGTITVEVHTWLGWVSVTDQIGREALLHPEQNNAFVSFINEVTGLMEARMQGLHGAVQLKSNCGTGPFTYDALNLCVSYLFLSATDKEELAVVRMNVDQNAVVSATFKDFTPPSSKPSLRIARQAAGLDLSWPATGNYVLEGTASLTLPVVWSTVPVTPITNNGETTASVGLTSPVQYFRLRSTAP